MINDTNDIEEQEELLYEHFRLEVDKGQVPIRIDKYLVEHQPHSSRNRIQQAADAGFIHVNDKPVKSNYKVRPGDIVTLMLDRPHYDTTIDPEDIPLDVVYEDDDLMVINKPAGMVVHPGCGNFNGTLVNAIAWHLKDLASYDPNDPEVGLVHRIDKDTSGLLVVAKTPDAKTSLGKQFFNKTTHRSYNALVWGNFVEDEGRIEGNIGRDPKDRLYRINALGTSACRIRDARKTMDFLLDSLLIMCYYAPDILNEGEQRRLLNDFAARMCGTASMMHDPGLVRKLKDFFGRIGFVPGRKENIYLLAGSNRLFGGVLRMMRKWRG